MRTSEACEHGSMNALARGWQGAVVLGLLSIGTLVFSRSRLAEGIILALILILLVITFWVVSPDIRNRRQN